MRIALVTSAALAASASLAATALAADDGQKPGLWEQRVVKTVIDDGKQTPFSQNMATSQVKTKDMLAAMSKTNPKFSSEGNVRECITPEMAKHYEPPVRQEPGCEPPIVNRSANHMSIHSTCNTDGNESNFNLDVAFGRELIGVKADGTIKLANGDTHKIHTETESRYIGADCGGLPPDVPDSPPGSAAGSDPAP